MIDDQIPTANVRGHDPELEELEARSTLRLFAAEFVDRPAFERLLGYLEARVELIADDYVVSKQVLACLRNGRAAIRSRAEYLPQVAEHLDLADKFAFLLDLVILGERPSERMAGGAVTPQ